MNIGQRLQGWLGATQRRLFKGWQIAAAGLIILALLGTVIVVGTTRAAQPAGIAAADVTVRTVTGADGSATAACHADEVVLGGGFTGNAPLANYPTDERHWTVQTLGGTVQASVLCVSASVVGSVQIVSASVPAQGGTADCPAGTVLTGGGYHQDRYDPDGVVANKPIGSTWYVAAQSLVGSPLQVTAYAVCAHGEVGAGSLVQLAATDGNTEPRLATATATCPANQLPTGGGFEYPASPYWKIVASSPSTTGSAWTTSIAGTRGGGGVAWLVCLAAA